MSDPSVNIRLDIDGQEFTRFHIIQIRWQLGALTTFQVNFGDPNRNHRWIRETSLVEVYLSWGGKTPVKYFSGYITQMTKNVSKGRFMVTASGVNQGLHMRDKQAWDSTYNYLSYSNMKASEILSDLSAQVDSIDALINPHSGEPSLDYECAAGSRVLDNFVKVAAYGGYEWFIDKDGKLIVRQERDRVAANSNFNLLLGDYNSFTTLPDLPHIFIRNVSMTKDSNSLANFYKVTGKDGIYGTGFNQKSINKYGRTAEAQYTDGSLSSVQACEVVARRLADVNGEPRISIPIQVRGNTALNVGDVVYCDDLDRQIFTSLDNQYLRVMSKSDSISKSGWSSDISLGAPKKEITDVIS